MRDYEIYMWLLQNEEKEKEMCIVEMSAFWENVNRAHRAGKEWKREVEPIYIQWKIRLWKGQD